MEAIQGIRSGHDSGGYTDLHGTRDSGRPVYVCASVNPIEAQKSKVNYGLWMLMIDDISNLLI